MVLDETSLRSDFNPQASMPPALMPNLALLPLEDDYAPNLPKGSRRDEGLPFFLFDDEDSEDDEDMDEDEGFDDMDDDFDDEDDFDEEDDFDD